MLTMTVIIVYVVMQMERRKEELSTSADKLGREKSRLQLEVGKLQQEAQVSQCLTGEAPRYGLREVQHMISERPKLCSERGLKGMVSERPQNMFSERTYILCHNSHETITNQILSVLPTRFQSDILCEKVNLPLSQEVTAITLLCQKIFEKVKVTPPLCQGILSHCQTVKVILPHCQMIMVILAFKMIPPLTPPHCSE